MMESLECLTLELSDTAKEARGLHKQADALLCHPSELYVACWLVPYQM